MLEEELHEKQRSSSLTMPSGNDIWTENFSQTRDICATPITVKVTSEQARKTDIETIKTDITKVYAGEKLRLDVTGKGFEPKCKCF